jgi:hypothetical protein
MDTIDPWLKNICQEIQRLNYEIGVGLRIFTGGCIALHHLTAFNSAVAHRDKLIAQVMRHLAEKIEPEALKQPETMTKSAPAPNNLVRLPTTRPPD